MNDWQPIETAPHDGTEILAYATAQFVVVKFRKFSDGTACWEAGQMALGESIIYGRALTHWMPLPPPPEMKV